MPPMPPKMKSNIASAIPANAGSPHGNEPTMPKNPVFPSFAAYSSKVAKSAKAVINDGTTTISVRPVCSSFQRSAMPGSENS